MYCPFCEDELRTEDDIRAHEFICAEGNQEAWDTVKKLDRLLNEMLPGSKTVITVYREENHD